MKDKKIKMFKGTVKVCAHDVSFWWVRLSGRGKFTVEEKDLLQEHAEDRAKECLMDGYIEGELHYENELEYSGGWCSETLERYRELVNDFNRIREYKRAVQYMMMSCEECPIHLGDEDLTPTETRILAWRIKEGV